VISVVPDPVAVTREMCRVCRPGGRIVILNHFRSRNALMAWIERMISPFTVHIGFKSDLDLPAFLAQAELKPVSIDKGELPANLEPGDLHQGLKEVPDFRVPTSHV
jgi:phosphatidylethanolamine/phosphatidyl-N-methylethanolamine N-methyltransferase